MSITGRFEQWLEGTPGPWQIGQVAILAGFELRHQADSTMAPGELASLDALAGLREMVKTDSTGKFRPLRGAPNLRSGWRYGPVDVRGLIEALNVIYPAAVGFWAEQEEKTLHVSEFVGTARRQSGMYRITQVITQPQFDRAVAEVCERGCLRRRLWHPGYQGGDLGTSELPFLCPEACNYFVAKAREIIVADREKAAGAKAASV